jgi:anti-sigma regulatory factor (Ser/Thr protein kinase)
MKSDTPARGASAPTTHAAALTFSLRKSSPPPIELARRTIRTFLQNLHRTAQEEEGIRLIVEEWLKNLVKHGCLEGRTHLASLTLINLGTAVRIRLEDDCAAFDPTTLAIDVDAEPRKKAELGVQLIRAGVEQFDYERRGERNVWEMIRQLASSSTASSGTEEHGDGHQKTNGAKNGTVNGVTMVVNPADRRDQDS